VLPHLESALYVFSTFHDRGIPSTDPGLTGRHRSTFLSAYKDIRALVRGVTAAEYALMAPADVRQFIQAGILDLLSHEEAPVLGFAAPEESWLRGHGGRMRIREHLDWLNEGTLTVYGTQNTDRSRWRDRLYNKLVAELDQALLRYGPPE
jgi:hypothetical protein